MTINYIHFSSKPNSHTNTSPSQPSLVEPRDKWRYLVKRFTCHALIGNQAPVRKGLKPLSLSRSNPWNKTEICPSPAPDFLPSLRIFSPSLTISPYIYLSSLSLFSLQNHLFKSQIPNPFSPSLNLCIHFLFGRDEIWQVTEETD